MHVPGLGLPLETKTISAVTPCEMLTGDEKDADWRGKLACGSCGLAEDKMKRWRQPATGHQLSLSEEMAWHILESNPIEKLLMYY